MTELKFDAVNSKHKRFWWAMLVIVILILVLLVCGVWAYPLFHTKSIVLMASPGNTTMVEIAAGSYVQNTGWYDSKEVPITGDPINPEDYWVHQYTCENGKIIGRRTEKASTSLQFQVYLTNNCDAEVKIEIWWFDNFDLFNNMV